MFAKKFTLIATCAFLCGTTLLYADDERDIDRGYNQHQTKLRTDHVGSAVGVDEFQVQTVLDPRLTAIELEFAERAAAIENQMALAPESDYETLQIQMGNLKREWHLALTRVQVEIALEHGDAQTAQVLTEHLRKIENPAAPIRRDVRRDPVTGAALEGGQE